MFDLETRLNKGCVRTSNQDWVSWRIRDNRLVCVVCDGIGGFKHGDRASRRAADEFINQLLPAEGNCRLWKPGRSPDLNRANLAIRRSIARLQAETNENLIGTTLTGICITESKFWVSHIGDSKAFLMRSSSLTQLTKDHNFAQEKDHLLKRDPASFDNVLTRALGISNKELFDTMSFRLEDDDRIILCTDGLQASGLGSEMLQQMTIKHPGNKGLADELEAEALAAGAPDNFCFALIKTGQGV
jgi:PPM family protein phosphatase